MFSAILLPGEGCQEVQGRHAGCEDRQEPGHDQLKSADGALVAQEHDTICQAVVYVAILRDLCQAAGASEMIFELVTRPFGPEHRIHKTRQQRYKESENAAQAVKLNLSPGRLETRVVCKLCKSSSRARLDHRQQLLNDPPADGIAHQAVDPDPQALACHPGKVDGLVIHPEPE